MDFDSLIGLSICEAKVILKNEGLELGGVDITAPPRERPLDMTDDFMIVRICGIEANKVSVLVCRPMKQNLSYKQINIDVI